MKVQTNYEPKRKDRFAIKFNDINIEPFVVQNIILPKLINNKWKIIANIRQLNYLK
jgi:hypothetical protein